jgi:hypothetical protein
MPPNSVPWFILRMKEVFWETDGSPGLEILLDSCCESDREADSDVLYESKMGVGLVEFEDDEAICCWTRNWEEGLDDISVSVFGVELPVGRA